MDSRVFRRTKFTLTGFVFITLFLLFDLAGCNLKSSRELSERTSGNRTYVRTFNITAMEKELGVKVQQIELRGEVGREQVEYSYTEEPAWEKNEGQISNPHILYYAHVSWGYVAVTKDSIYYHFTYMADLYQDVLVVREYYGHLNNFRGFNITPVGEIDQGKINYFFGDDSDEWVRGVKRYRYLDLGEIVPGIEMELHVEDGHFVKILHVKKASALKGFSMRYLDIEFSRDLKGEIYFGRDMWAKVNEPVLVVNGEELGRLSYIVSNSDCEGEELGELEINDPSSSNLTVEGPFDIEMDFEADAHYVYFYASYCVSKEGVYVAGEQYIPRYTGVTGHLKFDQEFRTIGYVCRYDHDLHLLSKTYFAAGREYQNTDARTVAVDSEHGVYIAGSTTGKHLPGRDRGYQKELKGSSDAYVLLFSHDLQEVKSGTYLGSSEEGEASRIVLGKRGVYVFGRSTSIQFPRVLKWGRFWKDISGWIKYLVLLNHGLNSFIGSVAPVRSDIYPVFLDDRVYMLLSWESRHKLEDYGFHDCSRKGIKVPGEVVIRPTSFSSDLSEEFNKVLFSVYDDLDYYTFLDRVPGVGFLLFFSLYLNKGVYVLNQNCGFSNYTVQSGKDMLLLVLLDDELKVKDIWRIDKSFGNYLDLCLDMPTSNFATILSDGKILLLSPSFDDKYLLLLEFDVKHKQLKKDVLAFRLGDGLELSNVECSERCCNGIFLCGWGAAEKKGVVTYFLEFEGELVKKYVVFPYSYPLVRNTSSRYEGNWYFLLEDLTTDGLYSDRGVYGIRFVLWEQPVIVKIQE